MSGVGVIGVWMRGFLKLYFLHHNIIKLLYLVEWIDLTIIIALRSLLFTC